MLFNKKGISNVVSIILILTMVVFAVVGFQNWYNQYASEQYTHLEETGKSTIEGIETISGNSLYFKSSKNLTIKKLKIGDIECNLSSSNLSLGINNINISNCSSQIKSGINDITIITDDKVYSKKIYLDETKLSSGTNSGSSSSSSFQSPYFVSIWNTSRIGLSNNQSIELPLVSSGTYNFNVSWGDGSYDIITSWNDVNKRHTYVVPGVYEVNITGTIIGWSFGSAYATNTTPNPDYNGDSLKLLDVKTWGPLNLGNTNSQFKNAYYFTGASISDNLNLSGTYSLQSMFRNCHNYNGNISDWDVSKIISMREMFRQSSNFNQPLNNWNVSSVTDMGYMFFQANSFNQPLNNWNVSSVTDMRYMFYYASSFNGNISDWDVSKVKDMNWMFSGDNNFNQPLNNWNVSNVINMSGMFLGASSFNGNISDWDVSKVKDMSSLFNSASNFNQPLNNWNVSSVTNMRVMFNGANKFNQPLNNWDVSNVTNMNNMFSYASNFNQNLTMWCVINIPSEPTGFAFSSPLDTSGMKPIWGTCP